MGSSVPLVQEYVESILNGHARDVVDKIFAYSYIDHHPLRIPGVIMPSARNHGHVSDIQLLVNLLDQPGVDFVFTLEDVFESADRVAYRIFGEGTVPVANLDIESQTGDLNLDGSRLQFSELSLDTGMIGDDRLHVTYRSVGIFRVGTGQLVERWGASAFV